MENISLGQARPTAQGLLLGHVGKFARSIRPVVNLGRERAMSVLEGAMSSDFSNECTFRSDCRFAGR